MAAVTALIVRATIARTTATVRNVPTEIMQEATVLIVRAMTQMPEEDPAGMAAEIAIAVRFAVLPIMTPMPNTVRKSRLSIKSSLWIRTTRSV